MMRDDDNTTVDITGLDKARVLCALYDAAKTQGMGRLHYVPGDMSIADAARIITRGDERIDYGVPARNLPDDGNSPRLAGFSRPLEFDYLKGRVLKVDISGDTFGAWGYDRDNGEGAAHAAIERLRRRLELERVESAVVGRGEREEQAS